MKTLFKITIHSFADLITNSSSELFVCDSEKSLEAVEAILQTLLETHNKLNNTELKFEDVFRPVTVSEYAFDYYDCPNAVKDRYSRYKEYGVPFDRGICGISNREVTPELRALMDLDQALEKKHKIYDLDEDTIPKEEFDSRYKAYHAAKAKLWTAYGANGYAAYFDLFIEFLKQNKFSEADIELASKFKDDTFIQALKLKKGRYFHGYMDEDALTPEIRKAYAFFMELENWGIEVDEGTVMVYSRYDNTIPYEMLSAIESYLNASRYRLD